MDKKNGTLGLTEICSKLWFKDPETKLAERLCASELYKTEGDVVQNFDSLLNELETWIDENASERSKALLKLLIKEKIGDDTTPLKQKLRRDGTPNAIHEAMQSIRFIRDVEDGMQVNNPDRVLSLILSHDMGEDFGWTPELLKEYLLENNVPDDEELNEFLEEFEITSYHFRTEQGYKKGEKVPRYDNKVEFIKAIHGNENTAIAKFYDNTHNIDSAIFGFKTKEKAMEYSGAIKALLPPDKMQNLYESYPDQKDALIHLRVTLSNSYRPLWNWFAGDIGQDIDVKPENKIAKQTRLPAGLDSPEVGAARLQQFFEISKDLEEIENRRDNPEPSV